MRIDASNLHAYAKGCAILGAGGGGDTRIAELASRDALEIKGPVDVVSLDDLPDDELIMPIAGWGAPTVGIEKFDSGNEAVLLIQQVERWFDRPVGALMVSEVGGGNGVRPVGWAAQAGLPLVDADAIGRALPEGDMHSMNVASVPSGPAFFADERDNVVTVVPVDEKWLERIGRHLVMAFGGVVVGVTNVMEAMVARDVTVRGSLPLALAIGEALETQGTEGVLRVTRGRRLVRGKVIAIDRRTVGGFARGSLTIEGTGEDHGRLVTIDVQNENLRASQEGRTLASVPDLLTVVDEVTGVAISTESLRYGQRCILIGIPSPQVWRTQRGLAVAGPERFGFSEPFVPVEKVRP